MRNEFKIWQIQKFAFGVPEEIFHNRIIQVGSLATHALLNALFS